MRKNGHERRAVDTRRHTTLGERQGFAGLLTRDSAPWGRQDQMADRDTQILAQDSTNWKARFVALAVIIIGVSLGFWADHCKNWILKGVLNAGASGLIPIGAISFLYDVTMRRQIQRELLTLVRIEKSISRYAITGAGQTQEFPWSEKLRQHSEYLFILTNPNPQIESIWHAVADAARGKKVSVKMLLPDPDAAYMPTLANLLNIPASEFRESTKRSAKYFEDQWKSSVAQGQFKPGCSCEIRNLDEMPTYSIVAVDSEIIAFITTPFGKRGLDPDLYICFSGSRTLYPSSWFIEQFSDKNASTFAYAKGAQQ